MFLLLGLAGESVAILAQRSSVYAEEEEIASTAILAPSQQYFVMTATECLTLVAGGLYKPLFTVPRREDIIYGEMSTSSISWSLKDEDWHVWNFQAMEAARME